MCAGENENEVWTELDPELFRPFSIPFHLTGTTQVCVCVCYYISLSGCI